jgi:NADPH-dependent 2,4-dienoyl-CoA reductase/sulfur reductase-like enzyme/nitrite reductase/ring-hydroxylating ferredoxin subunit
MPSGGVWLQSGYFRAQQEAVMTEENKNPTGPDFTKGIPDSDLAEGGMMLGHVRDEAVLLARSGGKMFAIGAECTHYHGPLAEGVLVGDTVRCPWHHACFSLRTGEALRAPALDPVSRWRVEQRGGTIYVRDQLEPAMRAARPTAQAGPESIVIIGGGAAGNAAAEMLRREGYARPITMLSADDAGPYDRPNLSKDYLAGAAPEEWIPLRPREFYIEHGIELKLSARAMAIDAKAREVRLADGARHHYGALLLATGAAPVRLDISGGNLPHVRYLRTLADSRALIAATTGARRAVVVGASFIGLEVAASLRKRGLQVYVVAPEARPMENVLGREVGDLVQKVHEENGISFHLGTTPASFDGSGVALRTGEQLTADFVVVGIGVRPETALAEQAGIAVDRGVTVDAYLETSMPGIWAAGDIARWPDRLTGEQIRTEHWVVAERQGQTAARNMLGARERFDAVPFFWTQQHDLQLSYVGHASKWDRVEIDGRLAAKDCTVTYRQDGRKLAVLTIARDRDNLAAEIELEKTVPTAA